MLEKGSNPIKRAAPYRVRGEVGEYTLSAYDTDEDSPSLTDSVFPAQRGKAYYQTAGFRRRYVHKGCGGKSYRSVSKAYEQETFQQVSLSGRSLQDMVVAEGKRLQSVLEGKRLDILKTYGIAYTRDKTQVSKQTKAAVAQWHYMESSKVQAAYEVVKSKCSEEIFSKLQVDLRAYENPEQTINISNDDVGVKAQKLVRKELTDRILEKEQQAVTNPRANGRKVHKKRKYVYQNVTHFEHRGKTYKIIGAGLRTQLNSITAFLLHNNGLKNNWTFYLDGQRIINESIAYRFGWRKIDMILDWYHLDKKINKQLFRAVKCCDQRDKLMQRLKKWAWYGLVDEAISCIQNIKADILKNKEEQQVLIGYFERNRNYIKCYAVRKVLGLRLSSNQVEKANDELVAARQKKNGMSFTRNGSYSLAVIKSLELNQERERWIKTQDMEFQFAA